MKTIGMFEAKAKLSEICQRVARTGEPVLITRRGVPLVRIDPIEEKGGASEVWEAAAEFRRTRRITEDLELPPRDIGTKEQDLDL
jgi:prevent-host-death family protein